MLVSMAAKLGKLGRVPGEGPTHEITNGIITSWTKKASSTQLRGEMRCHRVGRQRGNTAWRRAKARAAQGAASGTFGRVMEGKAMRNP
jgi:hypothetical protein